MNERIKQLLIQSEVFNKDGTVLKDVTGYELNKFAELIIRGCARKANATALDLRNNPDLDGRKYVGDCILKCFGVEE